MIRKIQLTRILLRYVICDNNSRGKMSTSSGDPPAQREISWNGVRVNLINGYSGELYGHYCELDLSQKKLQDSN